MSKKAKRSYHTIAIQYIKGLGYPLKHGSWGEILKTLVSITDESIPLIGVSDKSNSIEILKRLGFDKSSPKKPKKKKRQPKDVNSKEFLYSYAWRKLRMVVLVKYGAVCQCCGRSRSDGVIIHVDHIKPRRKYPKLALVESNLQVLCHECNHGKGNWDETDWREPRLTVLMGEEMG